MSLGSYFSRFNKNSVRAEVVSIFLLGVIVLVALPSLSFWRGILLGVLIGAYGAVCKLSCLFEIRETAQNIMNEMNGDNSNQK